MKTVIRNRTAADDAATTAAIATWPGDRPGILRLLECRLLHRADWQYLGTRQDETVAAARGVDIFAHKLAIFTISAAIAGIGGALKVTFLRAAAPLSFELLESINLVMIVILGGTGYLLGPLIGAVLFIALPEALRIANELRLVAFGAILVLLALYAPRGVCGLVADTRVFRGASNVPAPFPMNTQISSVSWCDAARSISPSLLKSPAAQVAPPPASISAAVR